ALFYGLARIRHARGCHAGGCDTRVRYGGHGRGVGRSFNRFATVGRKLLGDTFRRLADVHPRLRQVLLQAVEHRTGNQLAINADGALAVVIAGNGKIDVVGIGVAVDDRDDRDTELPGFGDRNRLLVGVDDEKEVGKATHFLDAAKGALELAALAREVQRLFLGEAEVFLA